MPSANENTAVTAPVEMETYPWHDATWSMLTRDLDRLTHALLLYGQNGLGKKNFALRLSQFLLCQKPGADSACGACSACALFRSGNHPDFLRVEPIEDSRNIVVDQVRAVIEFFALKAHSAGRKIVLVAPAEAMNVNAANSLLKILEEPPSGSLLILLAAHYSRIPATVRSRCMRVAFATPSLSQASNWLRGRSPTIDDPNVVLTLAGGAPLSALALVQENGLALQTQLLTDLAALATGRGDPITCAERWKTEGAEKCVEGLYRFLSEGVRANARVSQSDSVHLSLPQSKTFSFNYIELYKFIDKLSILKKQLGTGVDEGLALEELFITWSEMASTAV